MEERMFSAELSDTAVAKPAVWPLFAALGVLYALVAANLYASLRENGGILVYAVDDAYIHMAIAKNLAMHDVWGVTRYGFSYASSSPIWTSLLWLAYLITGINSYTPFALNIAAASGVVLFSWTKIKRHLSPQETAFVLAAIVVLAPLPPMIFVGMEHSLHILLSIVFLFAVSDALESPEGGGYKRSLLSAPFLVATRFEGLFLVFASCCLFFIRKQPKKALVLGLNSLTLVTMFGLYSIHKGWGFLPSSLLLKGGESLSSLGVDNLINAPHVMGLMALGLSLVLLLIGEDASRERTLMALFAGATVLHMVFASIGCFYRYETYIAAMGILVLALSLKKAVRVKNRKPLTAVVFVIALLTYTVLTIRAYMASVETPRATNNIYSQQYQMGLFLAKYFTGKTVAANDIGAISYLADLNELDLFGLGSKEVAAARQADNYDRACIERLCGAKGVDLVIVYDSWVDIGKNTPKGWERLAKWSISDNVTCAGNTVTFYAVNPKERETLERALKEFSPTLPAGSRYELINHAL